MKVKLPMQSSFCPGHQPGHFFRGAYAHLRPEGKPNFRIVLV